MENTWLNDCVSMYEGFRQYSYDDVRVFISNTETKFEAGQHSHAEYEFMLVRTKDVDTLYGGETITMKKGQFMPFNSFDVHGQKDSVLIDSFACIVVSAPLINEVAHDFFGFNGKAVFEKSCFAPSPNLNYFLGVLINESDSKAVNTYSQNLLIKLIISEFFKCSKNNVLTPTIETSPEISRAKKYLDENYILPFDLQKVADIAGMSKYHFIRKFKNELQKSPLQYILQLKIEKAKNMIVSQNSSLTEIGFELGFSTQSYFITQFKKVVGMAPGDFRKIILK